MLILSRQLNEQIRIGDDIVITITGIKPGAVSLGIKAPTEVSVHRQEVYEAIQGERDE